MLIVKKIIRSFPVLLGSLFSLSLLNIRTDADFAIGLGGLVIVLFSITQLTSKFRAFFKWCGIIIGFFVLIIGFSGNTVFQSFIGLIGGFLFSISLYNFGKE